MSLREQAAADLKSILEDSAEGFGWPISVTAPGGSPVSLVGFTTDIGHLIDPETGLAVSGRRASVSIAMASLTTAGLSLPKGVSDSSAKPWVVTFDDIHGTPHTFKVSEVMPDRAAGIVVCILEAHRS